MAMLSGTLLFNILNANVTCPKKQNQSIGVPLRAYTSLTESLLLPVVGLSSLGHVPLLIGREKFSDGSWDL